MEENCGKCIHWWSFINNMGHCKIGCGVKKRSDGVGCWKFEYNEHWEKTL